MGKKLDLTNRRFGNLVALYQTGEKDKAKNYIWRCVCDCGNEVDFPTVRLVHSGRKNCGCMGRKPTNHGLHKDRMYSTWQSMLHRCRKNTGYYEGVVVCDRWNPEKGGGFENFLADMGQKPEGSSLNRVSGAKLYSKETCEWADATTQSYDQRLRKDNESGCAGVSWVKKSQKWDARISKGGETFLLGTFENLEDAVAARLKAEEELYGFHRAEIPSSSSETS